MYVPTHFEESRLEVLHAFIRASPLATLVTLSSAGIEANHIPLHLSPEPGKFGTLRGHVARANPLWRDRVGEVESLAIFRGPDSYISPSWYATKREHGKVVPTWNYSVVHAHGTIRFEKNRDHGLLHVGELTDRQEASRPEPWKVSDAPADFIEPMLSRIVSFEITVTRLVGKFKASQHRPEGERSVVAAALAAEGASAADLNEVIRSPGQC